MQSTKEQLVEMTDRLHHRGPDSAGYLMLNHQQVVGLGHRRLSILDLSEHGSQPMSFDGIHIILNGEVYNFKEIRKELEQLGYTFISNSDTEVVLYAFHKWRQNCVQKFIGMFAFALYDEKLQEFYLFRDRAGVKPLYYSFENGCLLFSSELKGMIVHPKFNKNLNYDAISQFFSLGYIAQPISIYQSVNKLKAGHYLQLDLKSRKVTTTMYWNVATFYNQPKFEASENELTDELEKILLSAFTYRMVADVPVGVFLSGGYDSTAVAGMLQAHQSAKLNTFTIGFNEDKYNEAPYAKTIAEHLGTHHQEYYCTPEDARRILPKLADIFDEPFGDSSAIPTTLVSELARTKVTVALSADGGDEAFGGYNSYITAQKYINLVNRFGPGSKKAIAQALIVGKKGLGSTFFRKAYNIDSRAQKIINLFNQQMTVGQSFRNISQIFTDQELTLLIKNYNQSSPEAYAIDLQLSEKADLLDKLTAIDYQGYMMDDVLVKVDRASMSVSLEGREPLLDHRIIEFMARVPSDLKIRNGEKKYLLKKIVHRYCPQELLDRPKKGFSFPVFEWLKTDLNEYVSEYLNEQFIKQQGLFEWKYIDNLVKGYQLGGNINAQKVWLMLSFQLWYKRWIH
jgi:asparagine synthase (glutamine-hydrolysing)